MKKPDKLLQAFTLALMLVSMVCGLARGVKAAFPKEVTDAVEVIKDNQPVIAKNRPAHEKFEAAKASNEEQIGIMRKHGFDLDWSTMEPIPFQPGKAPAPKKEVLHKSAEVAPGSHEKQTVYQWKDAEPYKNERLAYYQLQLRNRGINKESDLKLLTAQIIQENGSLSENVHGDGGCSVGVLQYNACAHHNMSAKRFLETHPEWKDWKFQFDRMADMVADRYGIYDGNMKSVVIRHNCPKCVNSKQAKWKTIGENYYADVSSRLSLLSL